jgi:hypothetical protein
MSEALLTQRAVSRIIGQTRLRRLMRASWVAPVQRNAHSILFDPRDIRAALTRLERERCPPDLIEIARVRASEARNGHPRVRKEEVIHRVVNLNEIDFELDFSEFRAP